MDNEAGDADIATVARLLGDATRATFCMVLIDGRWRTAGELARAAGVAPSTASDHLSQLVTGGLLEVTAQGRHRYFHLASLEVAAAVEALALVAPGKRVNSLRQATAAEALRQGRTCYDHLAGRLGVTITEGLIGRGIITTDWGPGDLSQLQPLGIPTEFSSSRPLVRPCVDWTERRLHAAGALPAEMTRRLFELVWIERTDHHRGVRVTAAGRQGLGNLLRVEVATVNVDVDGREVAHLRFA
ncbi:MAG: ArsR/SmtB family transcription factor [Acidimicrobiales bacterium]